MELSEQVAIVTGAGQGIGRAIALELATMGARVVAADLNGAMADRTAAEVRTRGDIAVGLRVDVTRAADCLELAARVMADLRRIDVLVNNAGVNRRAGPQEVTETLWDATMNVNAKGVLFCCQAVLPHMLAAGRGRIVNVASQSGKLPNSQGLVYGASKAAVINMTKSLALAYARVGIRVNCVCPGSIDTPMWDELDHEVGVIQQGLPPGELKRRRAAEIPLRRLGSPEDVAQVVGFLASARSDYMTGQAVNVTGGLVMF
jgi:NAD(P)-dependent dehydrogenase (short-subunit alcohol dehydrogenase family)